MATRRSESENTHSHPENVLLFFFLCLIIGCACRFLLDSVKKKLGIRIPSSVVLLVIGGGLGAAAWENMHESHESSELMSQSLETWASIDPHLILFLFLPALIFECAMGTNFYVFSKHLFSAILLAGPGVLLQTFLVALVAKYVLPYDWEWTESLLFGAICSATDPVAVISLLKDLGTLPHLRVLIEAESLLNDGSAIVVYQLCLKILTAPESTEAYVASGVRMTLGAPALGTALYLASVFWMNHTIDPVQDTMVSLLTAYIAFWAAENPAVGTSGVLTVLTIGILMAGYGNTAISTEEGEHVQHAVWSILCFSADTIIFVLAGAIITKRTFLENSGLFTASDWGYLFALYGLLSLIRFFMVLLCAPFLRYFGYGLQPRNCSWLEFMKNMLVLTWGGLRGAVGLVLALSVSVNGEVRDAVGDKFFNERVLMLTAGMVVLTTLVNAALMEKFIDMLGMLAVSASDKELFKQALNFLMTQHEGAMNKLQNRHVHPELTCVDWQALEQCVGQDTVFEHHREEATQEEDGRDTQRTFSAESPTTSSASEDVGKETEREMLHRFLFSLRSSYTTQWHAGLLATSVLRKLLWALDCAVDHVNGPTDVVASKVTNSDLLRFDWGWLEVEGQLRLPWLVRQLLHAPVGVLQWLGRRLQVMYIREHVEMACATIKAHEEASNVELHANHTAFNSIMGQSQMVRQEALRTLEALSLTHPEAEASVRTRQACCLVLRSVREQVENLHETAQITHAEHDRLHSTIEDKLDYFHSNYPTVLRPESNPASLPVLRLLPHDTRSSVWEELALKPVRFVEGQEICVPGRESQGVYIVLRGSVKWTLRTHGGKGEGDATVSAAEVPVEAGGDEGWAARAGAEGGMRHSGMSFGEESLLLKVGGFDGQDVGRAVAATAVKVYLLPMERLVELVGRFPSALEQLWRQHGTSLLQHFPRRFHAAERFHTFFEGDCDTVVRSHTQRMHIKFPLLIVQGRARLADGAEVGPFTFVYPQNSETLEPSPETQGCIFLSLRPQHSMVGLRTQHMGHSAKNFAEEAVHGTGSERSFSSFIRRTSSSGRNDKLHGTDSGRSATSFIHRAASGRLDAIHRSASGRASRFIPLNAPIEMLASPDADQIVPT